MTGNFPQTERQTTPIDVAQVWSVCLVWRMAREQIELDPEGGKTMGFLFEKISGT